MPPSSYIHSVFLLTVLLAVAWSANSAPSKQVDELNTPVKQLAVVSGANVKIDLSYSNYWKRIRRAGQSITGHWVSAAFTVRDGKCTSPRLLSSFGVDVARLQNALENASKAFRRCSKTDDGSGILGDELLLLTRIAGSASGYYIRNNESFRPAISGSALFSLEALDSTVNDCLGSCTPGTILMVMFAKANYLEAMSRPVTANLWRFEALSAARSGEQFERAFRRELETHINALYNYAIESQQIGLVYAADSFAEDLLNGDGTSAKQIRAEAEKLSNSMASSKKNNELIIPLVASSPYYDDGGAMMVMLSRREFAIRVERGRIDKAYLRCVSGNASHNLQLQIDRKDHWLVPDSFGSCQLLVLGENGSRVELTEYP